MRKTTTVIVIGLNSDQARRLEKLCPGVELKFVESKGDTPRIPQGDHVILLVKRVRHLWTNEALKRWPRNRVHYYFGGTKELSGLVNGIAAGKVSCGVHHQGVA